MQIIASGLVLSSGVVLLVAGASALVEGAAALARRVQVSELVIGMTVVAFGTSAPELAVNLSAALSSNTELVLGNVVGSNVFNTLAVIGCAAVVHPLVIGMRTSRLELPFSIIVAVMLIVLIQTGLPPLSAASTLTRVDGLVFLAAGVVFSVYIVRTMYPIPQMAPVPVRVHRSAAALVLLAGGVVLLMVGGRLTVDAAVRIAVYAGVSTRVIALTVVAIGTSLPELAASVVAVGRGNTDMAVGNVIGSNVINIALVLGISVVLVPIADTGNLQVELVTHLCAVVAVLLFVYLGRGRRIVRSEGVALLAGYGVYLLLILRG